MRTVIVAAIMLMQTKYKFLGGDIQSFTQFWYSILLGIGIFIAIIQDFKELSRK